MRLCCLLLSRPRPARNLLRLFVGLGINWDCLTLALSSGTFPLPLCHVSPPASSPPLKKTEEMYQLCISGTGSSQKKRQFSKNEEECSGTGICKHRSAIYNNYSNRFAGASKTDNHHSAFQMIKKTLEEILIVSW